jgi:putative membrane protein
MYDDGNFYGMHLIWWFIWIVLLIWFFLTPWGYRGRRGKEETPLDILKKRFASGEINKEEYEERKQVLKKN